MIIPAGKYTPVPTGRQATEPNRPKPPRRPTLQSQPSAGRLPILPKPAWKDLDRLADQVALSHQNDCLDRSGVRIFVPRYSAMMNYGDWVWKGMRGEGWLQRYWQAMRHLSRARLRAVARRRAGFRQNNKAEHRLLASIPAYEYFSARKYVDPDFWRCNRNLKNWKRDNDDACVYI